MILIVAGLGIMYAINEANAGFFERLLGIDLFNFIIIVFALMGVYMTGLWLSDRTGGSE